MTELFDHQLFRDYFEELWGKRPFPWQERLAKQVVEEDWPEVIDLPTASGKTACIDIAVFALACGHGSRRIFFIVDRKVIVDEAFSRAQKLAEKLRGAKQGILQEIATRLRNLCGKGEQNPLHVCQLRGGIFRDESWVKSPLQPMVVASTVDQVGSRLLFRGYGIANNSQPIHAGLIANDSLLLLDEAHCSKAFAQTLERVQHYRDEPWRAERSNTPFAFVEMTATPSRLRAAAPFRLNTADREDEVLGQRLAARKMTRFVAVKAKTDNSTKLAADLIREAQTMTQKPGVKRVAVMANRVETARAVAKGLGDAPVTLVVGRMRPVDRTGVESDLGPLHSGVARADDDPLRFVVSTQCLEVGADLDFDALVTELASMDALLQRFGRLNRLGQLAGGAFACVVAPAADVKKPDPVYGQALPATREWLEPLFAAQSERDFGMEGSEDTVPRLWQALPEEKRRETSTPAPVCPVLWPAHLDALAQTSPRPVPEPAVEYFLHGKQSGAGEVSVVWRSELDTTESGYWEDVIALCPPVAGEALPVKIWALRAWMNGIPSSQQIDVEGGERADVAPRWRLNEDSREVLVWQGQECFATRDSRRVRPGDTVVLPAALWPAPELGYAPPGAAADVGDEAYLRGRNAVRLRLYPAVMANWPAAAHAHFDEISRAEEIRWVEVQAASLAASTQPEVPTWLKICLDAVARGRARQFTVTPYPGQRNGWVVESKKTLQQMTDDGGRDEGSRGEAVSLREHTVSVEMEAQRLAGAVLPPEVAAAVRTAARWHDAGKADDRFQALLFGGDATAAQLSPVLRAKGEFSPQLRRRELYVSSGLPNGFRHELTSLLLAEKSNLQGELRDLVLHLVASHHGYCRPCAPVVMDDTPGDVFYDGLKLAAEERRSRAAHALDRGVAERFWRLTRRYGWWGLAYMEALLRLADWKVSSEEQRRRAEQDYGDPGAS